MPLGAQTSAEMRQILERLDRLEEQNRALVVEIQALRAELAAARAPAPPQNGGPPVQERLAVDEARIAEQAQTKVEASQRFPIRVTGMALFNSFYNSGNSGGIQYPSVAAPGGQASGGASFRQTIVGLDYDGPHTFGGGQIRGALRMDLFGGSGRTLDQLLRLRTATLGINWKERSFRAGIDKPIISQREPDSLAQVGVSPLTGAGNLWLWIPQARFEQDFRFGEQAGLRAQVGVVQTHELGPNSTVTQPAYTPELEASRPGLEGRLELFGGTSRRIEIAPGFHHSVSHVAETSVPSDIFSFDWLARPWERVELTGEFFTGHNVANLGSIRQGIVVLAPRRAYGVHSRGGWGQLALHASSRLSFHLFTGQQDDRNSDLQAGAIGKNLAFGANFYYHLASNVISAFETSQTRTNYIGAGTLVNNHYDLALAYLF